MKLFTERQKEIIKASIDIISEKGIQNLTIKNLSRSIGISEPAIYRHFESKMDILIAILTQFEKFIPIKNDFIQNEEVSSIDKLREIVGTHFSHFAKNPAFAAVIFSEEIFRDDKKLAKKIFSIMRSNFDRMLAIIRDGQKKSEIRSDIHEEQITNIIMGGLRLIVKKWRLSDHSFNIERQGIKFWNTIKILITENRR
jgi:AcrR family transcriptional regulator